jgi:hypothetical protein
MFKKFLCIFLCFNLAYLGGCTGLVVSRDKDGIQIQESQAIFISQTPAGEYPKIKLSRNYTVYQVQERIKKDGELKDWALFINTERVVLRNYGGKGAARKLYGPGYLEPGHIFAAKLVSKSKEGRLYEVKFIGQCGNDVPAGDLMVLVTPDAWKYTDVDYTPAIWTGLAGILIGLGLGYLFWYGHSTHVIYAVAAKCLGGPAAS